MAKTRITGLENMTRNIKMFQTEFPDRVMKAMYQEAQIEMTESKRRVPVDTGTLKASGTVEKPTRNGKRLEVNLTYGGKADAYAVPVHENLEVFHKTGQPKYLESVLTESTQHMPARIGRRLLRYGLQE